jgi:hypothetical protein
MPTPKVSRSFSSVGHCRLMLMEEKRQSKSREMLVFGSFGTQLTAFLHVFGLFWRDFWLF